MRSRVHVHVLCWWWRRWQRAQLEVAHPCELLADRVVGVIDRDQLTIGMRRLRSRLLRGHGAMDRQIHKARVNESIVLDLYSFNTLIWRCGQVIWSVHGRCSMVCPSGSYEENCGLQVYLTQLSVGMQSKVHGRLHKRFMPA